MLKMLLVRRRRKRATSALGRVLFIDFRLSAEQSLATRQLRSRTRKWPCTRSGAERPRTSAAMYRF